jgi:YVTN family beta-propeller protein
MEQLERMCAAVPPPDRQRLAAARAQLITAITASPAAGHAARGAWPAISWRLRRRWLGWAAPLAAAGAVVGVILGTQGVFSTVRSPAPAPSGRGAGVGLARPVTAYVAGQSGTVTPILTATNIALAPIRIGHGPDAGQNACAIVFLPDGKTAYVLTNTLAGGPGTVIPIRTGTNTALRPIPIGPAWPAVITIAITPDSKTAYVTNAYTDTVTPIRTTTNTALAPIKVGESPVAIAITPDGKTAYVVNFTSGPGRPGIVTPIQTATNQTLGPIEVGYLSGTIAITP